MLRTELQELPRNRKRRIEQQGAADVVVTDGFTGHADGSIGGYFDTTLALLTSAPRPVRGSDR